MSDGALRGGPRLRGDDKHLRMFAKARHLGAKRKSRLVGAGRSEAETRDLSETCRRYCGDLMSI
jgi:hypothetical protein